MPATKENAPSRGTSSAEGNDQNPTKGTIEMNATSVPSTTDTALEADARVTYSDELADIRPAWATTADDLTLDPGEPEVNFAADHGTVSIGMLVSRVAGVWENSGPLIRVHEWDGITAAHARKVAADLIAAADALEVAK